MRTVKRWIPAYDLTGRWKLRLVVSGLSIPTLEVYRKPFKQGDVPAFVTRELYNAYRFMKTPPHRSTSEPFHV